MSPDANGHPRELVSAYHDGELGPREAALLEAHLGTCTACRALLEDYRLIAASAGSDAVPPVPADLRARIRERLGGATVAGARPARFRLRSFSIGLAAAAGAVLVVGLWIVRQESVPAGRSLPATEPSAATGSVAQGPAPTAVTTDEARRIETEEAMSRPIAPESTSRPAPSLSHEPVERPMPAAPRVRQDRPSSRYDKEALPEATTGMVQKDETGARLAARSTMKQAADAVAPAPAAGRPEQAPPLAEGVAAGPSRPEVRPRLQVAAPGRGRILRFEYPDHVITVSEDGRLGLASGSYSCSVQPGGPTSDPRVARLFDLAQEPGLGGAAQAAPESFRQAPAAARIILQDERGAAPRAGGPAGVGPSVAAEMERRLNGLLKDTYLGLLESQCGAVPTALRPR